MLFHKSPGNEKSVSLKCMLNAKLAISIAKTGVFQCLAGSPHRWRWPISIACSQKSAHSNVHQVGQQQGGTPQRSRGVSRPCRQTKKSQYGLWDGDALLSHRVAPAVPSARVGLTSGFGMGPGVPPQQESPAHKKHWLSWMSFALSAEDKKGLCAHNREEASTIFRIMGASHVKHN